MVHLPFSTQGLFFISSGFRKGSSGMPSSIHFTNLQGEEGGWAQPQRGSGQQRGGFGVWVNPALVGGDPGMDLDPLGRILGGTWGCPHLWDTAGRKKSHPGLWF